MPLTACVRVWLPAHNAVANTTSSTIAIIVEKWAQKTDDLC